MSQDLRAAIDLGSNSVLITVMRGDKVILDEARVVGLGRGLSPGGPLQPPAMARALRALQDFARKAEALGVAPADIVCGATSASRRAANAQAFYDAVHERTGLRFRILTGDEEAQLTFAGASSTVQGRVAVVDLGGGSTEVAIGEDDLEWARSYPIGSVRLTETVLGPDVRIATHEDVARMTELVSFDGVPEHVPVVGVAGTVTTFAAWVLELDQWDAEAVEGSQVTDAHLAEIQQALVGRDAGRRRELFAVGAERADSLLAGATILRAALAALGQDALRVSVRGLRFGLLG